MRLDNQQV